MDVGLGGDVHAVGRLLQEAGGRVAVEPRREQYLLLVSAGKRGHGRVLLDGGDAVALPGPSPLGVYLAPAHQPRAEPPPADEVEVLVDAEAGHEPVGQPVAGDASQARGEGRTDVPRRDLRAVHRDPAAFRPAQPGEQPEQLGLAVPGGSEDRHDLSGPDRQVERVQPSSAQPGQLQYRLAGSPARAAAFVHGPVADHGADQRGHVEFRGARRGCHAAVSHHRDAVGEVEHLVEVVGDVDDRRPPVAQRAHQAVDPLGVAAAQGGGRLVQDQHPAPEVDLTGDLHEGLLGGAEGPGDRVRRDVDAEPVEGPRRLLARPPPQHPSGAGGEPAQQEVLGHRQAVHQGAPLVDDAHPRRVGAARGERGLPLPVDEDVPAVRGERAADHLDERRLAGPVHPDDGVHLARQQREVDACQRLRAAERLAHVAQLQYRRHLAFLRVQSVHVRPRPERAARTCPGAPRRGRP